MSITFGRHAPPTARKSDTTSPVLGATPQKPRFINPFRPLGTMDKSSVRKPQVGIRQQKPWFRRTLVKLTSVPLTLLTLNLTACGNSPPSSVAASDPTSFNCWVSRTNPKSGKFGLVLIPYEVTASSAKEALITCKDHFANPPVTSASQIEGMTLCNKSTPTTSSVPKPQATCQTSY
jgi:hypothetical protein